MARRNTGLHVTHYDGFAVTIEDITHLGRALKLARKSTRKEREIERTKQRTAKVKLRALD